MEITTRDNNCKNYPLTNSVDCKVFTQFNFSLRRESQYDRAILNSFIRLVENPRKAKERDNIDVLMLAKYKVRFDKAGCECTAFSGN
jgi:hypothetical protein